MTLRRQRLPRSVRLALDGRPSGNREKLALAVSAVRCAAEADGALQYAPARAGRDLVPLDWVIDATPNLRRNLEGMFRSVPRLAVDFSHSHPVETRRFLDLDELLRLHAPTVVARARQFFDLHFEPRSIIDQRRLVVFAGERMVGWIGAFRLAGQPSYETDRGPDLQPLVPGITRLLIDADAHAAEASKRPDCHVVARPDGTIEYSTAAAAQWLDDPRVLGRIVGAVRLHHENAKSASVFTVPEGLGRISQLTGEGGLRYLVVLSAVLDVVRSWAALLSPKQHEIAQLAAVSCTVDEIARHTSLSRETVRTHLREVYRRLGVGSRVELARIMGAPQ